MRIARIHIENFRSIKSLDFNPSPLCAVIGENNAGKSNIMHALNLILGDTWPSERSFSADDFYLRDTTNPIVIQVYFDETWETERNNATLKIGGFELRCKAYQKPPAGKLAGELKVDFTCIGPKGGQLTYPATPYKPQGQRYPLPVSGGDRARVPLIYIDVMREYVRQQPGGRWSVLRRLFDDVNNQFSADTTLLDVLRPDGTTSKLTRPAAFGALIGDAYDLLRVPLFKDIEDRLQANALEQMGIEPTDGGISIGFGSHDPANAFRNLQLLVEEMGMTSLASDVGAGLQSAIVVAIFRTYEELKKEGAIFAIEEPEAFLHPQKARYFSSILENLAASGNQVFLTTHSPIFVRLHSPETVALARRSPADGTQLTQVDPSTIAPNEKTALRVLSEFDTQRNEMFFARRVLLVEGDTEKVSMPFIFKALKVDANRFGISVIECGGKASIPLFAKVARAFGIPFVVLCDTDGGGSSKASHEVEAVCEAANLFYLNPDFETACGISKTGRNKLVDAHEKFKDASASDINDTVKAAITRLQAIQ